MSCCAPKTGLARFADDWRIILFSYLCALLPLAAIYALDFINRDWKSVRDTRRGGHFYLAFSLPPLAAVVFYIHVQRLAEDYKEMATAITAAILCILHVLRTIWGLIQLHVFKQWNMHALLVLTRIGFRVPNYIFYADEKYDSNNLGTHTSNSWSFINSVQKLCKLNKVHVFAQRMFPLLFRKNRDDRRTEAGGLVDKYMMVNNSLVDNEFFGAELPCGLNFSLLRKAIRKKRSPVSSLLTSRRAEEGVVRWTAAFLACFGSHWLLHTRRLTIFDTRSHSDEDEDLGGKDLPSRLLGFISFCITYPIRIELEALEVGFPRSQQVSALSPLHVMCSDLIEPWVTALRVTGENVLPHQLWWRTKIRSIELDEYAISLQSFLSKWPRDSLIELEEWEKHAVLSINPHQISCFNKLMEENNSHVLPKEFLQPSHIEKLKILLRQVGHNVEESQLGIDKWRETMDVFLSVFPILKESFVPEAYSCNALQASIHVDNWVALEIGYFPLSCGGAQVEVSEVERSQWGYVFSAQKRVELRRLQLEVATKTRTQIYSQVKFLGCVMEFVRSSLSRSRFRKKIDVTGVEWNPQILKESTVIFCSDQLTETLQEVHSESANEVDGEGKLNRKSVQMRLLWEIQRALMAGGDRFPGSPALMILCMLGYPSLRMSKVSDCQHLQIASSPRTEDVAVPVGPDDGANGAQEVATHSEGQLHSERNYDDSKHCCVRIDIVEAPQPLHIIFRLNFLSKMAEIWIRSTEEQEFSRFCWQNWKDGFMGRLWAQSEWRSTRLQSKTEKLGKDAIVSKVTEGISKSSHTEGRLIYWRGWPPFLSEIAGFERNDGNTRRVSRPQLDSILDRISGVRRSESVALQTILDGAQTNSSDTLCKCGCKEQKMFLEAQEMSDKGQEEEAFKLFRACIIDHMHYPALRHCVSNAIKHFPKNEAHLDELLRIMYTIIGRSGTENKCRKFKQYDLEDLIALFGALYDSCEIQRALLYKTAAVLLQSTNEGGAIDSCIKNFESLMLKDPNLCSSGHILSPNLCSSGHILSLCYFRKYYSTGLRMDKEIGTKHFTNFMRFSDSRHEAVDRAFVIEKGSLSRREYSRLNAPPREIPILHSFIGFMKIVEDIFLWSSNTPYRISKNAKTAFTIYSTVISDIKSHPNRYFPHMYKKMAENRLAMMYHRGSFGVEKDLFTAEELYAKAIGDADHVSHGDLLQFEDVQSINAMCNLGVMHSQQNDNQGSAEKSIDLFKSAIQNVEEKRWQQGPLGRHSASMNNLAVITESGKLVQKDIERAKELYRRAIGINESPIAMYNLAVLLKLEDPSPQNLEQAEELLSTVADLGADLQSMPVLTSQLEKAQGLTGAEISRVLPVELEEIDDCLAYVKMIESSRESFYLE